MSTTQASPAQPTQTTAAGVDEPPDCARPSPVTVSAIGPHEVEGRSATIQLWGLLLGRYPPRAPEQLKIVWRVTGAGPATFLAIDPAGRSVPLAWGPDAHGGSNYQRPGDEYGAEYHLNRAGCWDLRTVRGADVADVLLIVRR